MRALRNQRFFLYIIDCRWKNSIRQILFHYFCNQALQLLKLSIVLTFETIRSCWCECVYAGSVCTVLSLCGEQYTNSKQRCLRFYFMEHEFHAYFRHQEIYNSHKIFNEEKKIAYHFISSRHFYFNGQFERVYIIYVSLSRFVAISIFV